MQKRRKPLPYAASAEVDAALMANSDAVRSLLVLVREEVDPQEQMRRLAEAIHRIHESSEHLREAKHTETK